jgi:hypothetical protein
VADPEPEAVVAPPIVEVPDAKSEKTAKLSMRSKKSRRNEGGTPSGKRHEDANDDEEAPLMGNKKSL